jgi:hypothetical protein
MKQRSIGNVYSVMGFFAIFALLTCFYCSKATAQEVKEIELPRNAKIVKEYSDGRGHIVRELQYTQGSMLVTEQIIIPKVYTGIGIRKPIDVDTIIKDSVMLLVNKSLYCVQVYYRKKIIRAYKAVFGPQPKMNKCMEGDRCTPEGWYKISGKNPNSKYHRFMQINYPNDSSYSRFNTLKSTGKIPANARIGGSIGIHGIWKGGDDMIEMGVGWTDGCIALKNDDVEELYSIIGVGTKVFIKK